ncbi:NAD(P)H-binding protein [bacterium]|nr:NAD(P)H-binding protein [bacterium]
MNKVILVTGATGNVGSEVVTLLHNNGAPVRAAVTSARSAERLPVPVPWAILDYTNPNTYAAAFADVGALFLMRPPHIANVERDMKPLIEYAVASGVERIVFLSLLGADKNRVVPHAKVETLLQETHVAVTLLRAGFFMQNLSTTHRKEIRNEDAIFVPAGMGKTAFIDVRDIAAVAVKALTEAGRGVKSYELTGNVAYDYAEVAAMMTEVLGRPIRYADPSLPRFAWRMWRNGQPLAYTAVVSAIYTTTRFGAASTITTDTGDVLERKPISLHQFIDESAAIWQR